MQINFDKELKVDNQADINLYGKQLKLTLNDDFRKKVTEARLKIETASAKFDDDKYIEELAKKPYQEQKKVADDYMQKMHQIIITTIDDLLGKGIGDFLYKHFNGSTEGVSAVLGLLQDYADESVKNLKEERRKSKLAKFKNHH